MHQTTVNMKQFWLPRAGLDRLLTLIQETGYQLLGPQPVDGAIVYAPLSHAQQLPRGVHDHQQEGEYRLDSSDSPRCFAWANGPQCLKPLVFAATAPLFDTRRDAQGQLQFTAIQPEAPATAVIGVRACDLAALTLSDAHFRDDPHYTQRRQALFLVAVHCSHPAATCFCAATGDGPTVRHDAGHDLLLGELDEGFILSVGSPAGQAVLDRLITEGHVHTAPGAALAELLQSGLDAAGYQHRQLPDLHGRLIAQSDHPHWQTLGERCLGCGNCTLVCPSCFCSSEVEQAQLNGRLSHHYRQWDSCFSPGHATLAGFNVRADTTSRYRQWLCHKLDSWHDQYGRAGCVGCGRCISWCPVGIDITVEGAAFAQTYRAASP